MNSFEDIVDVTENISAPSDWAVYDIEIAKKHVTFNVKTLKVGDIVYYHRNSKPKKESKNV